jgi:hypothetical protein
MVFNATFDNISDISWRLVLLVEETRVPGENNRPTASHRQTFPLIGFEQSFSDDRNCIGSYKSNYHTITTQHSGR